MDTNTVCVAPCWWERAAHLSAVSGRLTDLFTDERASLCFVTYESLDSSPQVAEPSIEDLNLDKKESEVEVSLENDERASPATAAEHLRGRKAALCIYFVFPGGEGHHRSAVRKPSRVFQAEGESHDHQCGHLARLHPPER